MRTNHKISLKMEAALNKLFRRRKSKKSPTREPEPVPIPKIQSNYIETILDHYNQVSTVISGVPIAKRAEQEYRLTPSHWIFLGTSATMVLILSHPAQFVAEILGFLLPVSQSLRALETETVQDDIQWLTYWVVFACINMIEPLLSWIPRYYTAKAILILWLLMPQTRVATID